MYVFGGYGGAGFARRDFNDVSVLDLETWEWRSVECRGEHPEPRSGHQVRHRLEHPILIFDRTFYCMRIESDF